MAIPTEKQLEAVHKFAARHGRKWKERLAGAWWVGSDVREPDGALLRQVRNECGPLWLKQYKLPANNR